MANTAIHTTRSTAGSTQRRWRTAPGSVVGPSADGLGSDIAASPAGSGQGWRTARHAERWPPTTLAFPRAGGPTLLVASDSFLLRSGRSEGGLRGFIAAVWA